MRINHIQSVQCWCLFLIFRPSLVVNMSSCLSTFSILFLEDCSAESLILSGAACLAPANCTPNSHSILEAICCGSPQRHGKNNYNYTASFFCTVRDDVLAASLLLLGHCTRTNVMCDVCFVCVCVGACRPVSRFCALRHA